MTTNKKLLSLLAALLLCSFTVGSIARADDDQEIEKQEQSLNESSKKAGYEASLKDKYKLTDEQLQKLHSQGMNDAQITIAAQLAQSSGKPIDDIVKMRLEQKMGWGKIAKELGVAPREIGQAVASMHRYEHSMKHEHMDRMERKEHSDHGHASREDRPSHGHK